MANIKKKQNIYCFLSKIDHLIMEKQYSKAERYLREYIEMDDKVGVSSYPVIRKYGSVLRLNGKLEEALEILLPIEYSDQRCRVAYELAHIYAGLHEYENSMKYIAIFMETVDKYEKELIGTVLRLKRDVVKEKTKKCNGNKCSTYLEEKSLQFIESSYSFNNHSSEVPFFMEDTDLSALFLKLKEMIQSDSSLCYIRDGVLKRYDFHCNQTIGFLGENEPIEDMQVLTDSDGNIISFFPAKIDKNRGNLNYINLSVSNIEEKQMQKVNIRKSQIEKFNQKYGRMI